jgi:hypothetical protein
MSDLIATPEPTSEIESLARLLVQARRDRVTFYQREFGLSLANAQDQTASAVTAEEASRIANTPADELCWYDLDRLVWANPKQGVERWLEIKGVAHDELRSGHRAANAVEWDGTPWSRAQFCALRESIIADWQPRNGIELTLIDIIVQAHTGYEFWMRRLTMVSTGERQVNEGQLERGERWEPPRVTTAETMEQAAQMADRFHRLGIRTIRVLRDLRRYDLNVSITNQGQVNIGAQQMNAAKVEK